MSKEIRSRFVLRNKSKSGEYTIYLQFRFNGNPIKLPIGLKCMKQNFDMTNQRFKQTQENYINLNLVLSQKKSAFNDIIIRYTLAKRPITIEAIKNEFLNPEASIDFMSFFKHKLDIRKAHNQIVGGTWKQHNTTFRVLQSFKPNIQFKDITLDFIYQFEKFLKEKNNNSGTISTRMKNIKVYINLAIEEGLMDSSPFGQGKYRIQAISSKIIALTLQEREILQKYYFSDHISPHHKNALQGFLLSCFTGLRYSDLSRATWNDITKNNILRIKPLKTIRFNKTVEIPLIPIVFDIIEKRGSLCRSIVQNQPTNRVLKEIGQACEISTPMTTHVGRHTFGSLFIQSGGNVVTLQKLMGHSDIKETMGYVHLHDKYVMEEMQKFGEME